MKTKNLSLVIMAAGLGSRFGGLKQLEAVGPNNHIIMDYSIFDAVKAGFGKVVFVINKQLEETFRGLILSRYQNKIETELVFQELDMLPEGFEVPEKRVKPWGTGHALLVAEKALQSNFCVINADDFYGYPAFKDVAHFLNQVDPLTNSYCMAGYRLHKTLSPNGMVSRGVCKLNDSGFMENVTEHTKIEIRGNEIVSAVNGGIQKLEPNLLVSMNCWGFTPRIFAYLRKDFLQFLKEKGRETTSEFHLPAVVDRLVQKEEAGVRVFDSKSDWFGVTYKEDLENTRQKIRQKIDHGEYPPTL